MLEVESRSSLPNSYEKMASRINNEVTGFLDVLAPREYMSLGQGVRGFTSCGEGDVAGLFYHAQSFYKAQSVD